MATPEETIQELRDTGQLVFEIWKRYDKTDIPIEFQVYVLNFHNLLNTSTDFYLIKEQRQWFIYSWNQIIFSWEASGISPIPPEDIALVNQFNDMICNAAV